MAANPRRRRRKRRNPNPNPNPFRRRRRARLMNPRRRHKRRRNPLFGHARRRHTYRHNPPAIRGLARPLMWGAAGFVASKFVNNTVTPLVGASMQGSPVTRIGWKLAIAYITAWGLEMLGGEFTPAFIGASGDAVQDFSNTYLVGTIPGLSGMGLYNYQARQGMGLYQFPNRPQIPRHDAVA